MSSSTPIPPAAGPYSKESTQSAPIEAKQLKGPSPIPNLKPARKSLTTKAPSIPTPNKNERKVHYGIDCADLVHFTHWEPGGEHVKQLVIKNVVMKTQKIKYKLPKTRFFSMEFPETVTLSAGMSWTIPITFRPVAKESYNDVIEFTTSFGKFYLPIKATLPEHVLEYPKSIDFALCPLKETARRVFMLKNSGELASSFEWEVSKPFTITPRSGTLPPGQATNITIDFKPENASVFTANAICNFGDKTQWERSRVTQPLTIYGIGKYSHLSIEGNLKEFNFGDIFVGRSSEKKFVLVNHSSVPATFKIKDAERNTDPYFEFSVTSGTVPPHKSLEVSITYNPVAAGMESTEYYDITSRSGNTIRITCTGSGVGPCVKLNTNLVNFNDVPAHSTCMRPIYIQNTTPVPAFYQFLTEPNSIFRIDKPWGTIQPNSSVALTIKFSPTEPINYHRCVYCLVEHQDGMYIDFIGTCYNEKRRPATFHPKMLENYRRRVENGLWSFGPEHLEEMLKNGAVQCVDGILSFTQPEKYNLTNPVLDYPYNDGLIASEYFYENVGLNQAVTLLDTYIDFGSCSKYRVIDHQVIRIANNTKGKMSCVWHMPGESTGDSPVFSVSPSVADIPPKSSVEFRVMFRPQTDNSFYGQQLECFVYFKSMRNFRLVNDDTFTPPWCLTPTVAGNTFPPGEDTFIPKIEFGTSRLDFPACHVDKSVYQTVRIINTGDTPVKFAFVDTQFQYSPVITGGGVVTKQVYSQGIGGGTPLALQGGAPFSVKPRIGMLHKNESQLVVFRFSPSEQKTYEQALKCYFNSSLSNTYDLHIRGVGFFPQLTFENQNMLYFKPTCVGTLARRNFTARNTSRIKIKYEWKIPAQYANFVSIEPTNGVLEPNKSTTLTCVFCPNTEKNWLLKIPCYYSLAPEENETLCEVRSKRTTLTVVGTGTQAAITAEPNVLDFDAILVNTIVEKEIVIFNPSDCDVFYDLEVYRLDLPGMDSVALDGTKDDQILETRVPNSIRESEFEVIESADVFPARSNQVLKIRACVREQYSHEYRIYYKMKTQSKAALARASIHSLSIVPREQRFHLCDIRALGVYPIVQVTDVRSEGLGKNLLWKFFNLNTFNEMLRSVEIGTTNISAIQELEEEFEFPTDGVSGGEFKEPPSLDFNFGAAPVNAQPAVIHMSLMNPGVVPVEWIYYFPNDLEVEVENWADPGDYTEEQLHTNLILDNNLFTIYPKTGILNPGESAHIIMSYNHKFPGFHKLPVIFKLKNGSTRAGKEIVLYFVGNCIPLEQKCLFFPSSRHVFEPVSIGCLTPPVQHFRLANSGLLHLSYNIDLSPLKKLKSKEKDFDIFKCSKTSGSLAPGAVEYIRWIFRPLEVKEYSVDIPVTTDDGQTTIITFVGEGKEEPIDGSKTSPKFDDHIPQVQILPMDKQIAVISKEHINLGNIPIGNQLRELLVIRNISETDDLSFNWVFPVEMWGTSPSVKVIPASGELGPGESVVCKVIFTPTEESTLFNFDIECQIFNETEKAAFEKFKEDVRVAQREGRLMIDSRVSTAHSKQLLGSAGKSKHTLRGSKYNPLPDILGTTKPDASSVPDLLGLESGAVSHKPLDCGIDFSNIPPEPTFYPLYVTIHANIQPPDQFRSLFTGYDQFFRAPPSKYDQVESSHQAFNDNQQRNLCKDLLSNMLDDIIQDVEVQSLMLPENMDPLPYFAQISSRSRNGIFPVASGTAQSHTTRTQTSRSK
ncbi:hypothetical protein BCR33DRAFT_674998 [Rhizoclosmatium globosum]|uniref:MSP domain-containing protein n=1 Tax=Rhizoclosmatium globosum TaxID=329046 RepID=A0A1Y2D3G5_9FUNG|nr:hypothetical protein BCR33DRAFT_674998 [Rhizoclosmatium globosum]|eukprot:ORY53838.1 hypothetical protein BCR33DRAFT_674998 [Rhizoclosmatium globosum]